MKYTYSSDECGEEIEMQTESNIIKFSINILCDECKIVHTFILDPPNFYEKP